MTTVPDSKNPSSSSPARPLVGEIPRFRRVCINDLPPLLRRMAEILEREGRIVITEATNAKE